MNRSYETEKYCRLGEKIYLVFDALRIPLLLAMYSLMFVIARPFFYMMAVALFASISILYLLKYLGIIKEDWEK